MLSEQIIIIIFSFSLMVYFIYLIIFIIGFFLPRKYFSSDKPKASVIVAARDEAHCIARCINSLCTQTYPNEKFEIIIVNDQSKDATEEIIKALQKKYVNLELINIKNRPENFAPKKYAITEALKIATGKIILTTDADITVKPGWIESIVSFFEKDVGLVVGLSFIRNIQTKKFFQKFEALDFLMLLTATKGSIRIGLPISCTGQNLSFRKTAFDDVGGFGEENSTQSSDDVLLLHLIRRSKKWKITFADNANAYVETDVTKNLTGFLKQRIRWAAMGVGEFTKSINLTMVSIATATVNIGLLLLVASCWFISAESIQFLIIVLIVKFVIEFFIAIMGTFYFNKISWLWFFPFLFLLYMPYILIISVFSVFGNFKWKDRVYNQGKVK